MVESGIAKKLTSSNDSNSAVTAPVIVKQKEKLSPKRRPDFSHGHDMPHDEQRKVYADLRNEEAALLDPNISDPLAFHSNTKCGIYLTLIAALVFILIAYKMENGILRDGFSSMFMAMTDEFYSQPGDSSAHANLRTTARVGFVALLVFGATAIGGFIGSRFKPNEEKAPELNVTPQ